MLFFLIMNAFSRYEEFLVVEDKLHWSVNV